MAEIRQNEEINGRYVLKQSKGRGTFGEVWLAHDLATDEDVAIKFYVALDHKGREEFIQEFRIAAKLRHPNLLVTKDFGEWHGHPYLTMKFCDQGSAADLIGTLSPCTTDEMTIWRFVRDVASGLAYLHSVKPDPIVHQDIKPDNTLIDSDGTFLITDFGISKRIRSTMRKQSERALKAGAPAYMGPERFSNHPEPILASDIWSLGVSIYELAEGELPFCGMGGGMMLKGAEMPSLNEGWSRSLSEVMQWCLEEKTWNRAKACQVQEVAETVLKSGNMTSVTSLISRMRNGAQPESPNDETKKRDPHATKPNIDDRDGQNDHTAYDEGKTEGFVQRKKLLYAVMAAFILIIAIAVAWFSYSQVRTPQSTTNNDTVHTVTTMKDSLAITKAENEKPTEAPALPKTVTPKEPKSKDVMVKNTDAKDEHSYNGTLSLGYATWRGGIRNGKPDGEGTMTFKSTHRIDTRDPSRRTAEADDRVDGTYSNGHLVEGRWFKSDGTTEYIMLGE